MRSEKKFYAFSYTDIDTIQKHLKKNTEKSSIFNNYTIQSIIISRFALFNNEYMIKVKYDRWLGDEDDLVCEYIVEYYTIIDEGTLDVEYAKGQTYRE